MVLNPGPLKKRWTNPLKFLGVDKTKVYKHAFPVREFPSVRQEILETLVKLNAEIKPELVFIPSSSDIHQDHKTLHEEGIRAFKYTSILGYEMPWNNFAFKSYIYISLTKVTIGAEDQSTWDLCDAAGSDLQ